MKKITKTIAMLLLAALTFNACNKEKKPSPVPEAPKPPVNEAELITTVKLLFHETTTHAMTEFIFSDPDGPGGNPATFGNNGADSVITLLANRTYSCSVLLLDQSKNPTDTISHEVKDEGVDHMLFYNHGNNTIQSTNPYTILTNSLTIRYLDTDANNYGLGLETLWTTPTTAKPKVPLVIELKHQPGVKNGTYAPGETDIQVAFKVKVN